MRGLRTMAIGVNCVWWYVKTAQKTPDNNQQTATAITATFHYSILKHQDVRFNGVRPRGGGVLGGV